MISQAFADITGMLQLLSSFLFCYTLYITRWLQHEVGHKTAPVSRTRITLNKHLPGAFRGFKFCYTLLFCAGPRTPTKHILQTNKSWLMDGSRVQCAGSLNILTTGSPLALVPAKLIGTGHFILSANSSLTPYLTRSIEGSHVLSVKLVPRRVEEFFFKLCQGYTFALQSLGCACHASLHTSVM